MISAEGIHVDLGGTRVLDGVDVAVRRGEWLSVIGPNGAGKSTLLRWLAGLVRGAGELRLAGRDARAIGRRERARTVALVPQSPVVPPGVTVVDYVLLGRSPHIATFAVESQRDLAAVHTTLAQLELVGLADRIVTTLSGGERQRVLLARALAQAAPVVLLDEPTTALDVGHQQHVLDLVDRLRREHDLTVVTTMHDLTLAGQYADRLLLLDGGRVVADGHPEDVLTTAHLSRFSGARVRVVREAGHLLVLPVRPPPEGARREHLRAADHA